METDNSNAEKIFHIMGKLQKLAFNARIASGKPHSEIMMLRMIRMNTVETEGVTISTLSELLEISKSAVSQMVNVLENKGYVERMTTKNDRRLVYVRLTESGKQCLEKELHSRMQRMERVFEKMGEEDTQKLVQSLEKFYSVVSNQIQK